MCYFQGCVCVCVWLQTDTDTACLQQDRAQTRHTFTNVTGERPQGSRETLDYITQWTSPFHKQPVISTGVGMTQFKWCGHLWARLSSVHADDKQPLSSGWLCSKSSKTFLITEVGVWKYLLTPLVYTCFSPYQGVLTTLTWRKAKQPSQSILTVQLGSKRIWTCLLYANIIGTYSSSPLLPFRRSDPNLGLSEPHGEGIDRLTECTAGYIHFWVDTNVPARTVRCYPKNKPWVTKNNKAILNDRRLHSEMTEWWSWASLMEIWRSWSRRLRRAWGGSCSPNSKQTSCGMPGVGWISPPAPDRGVEGSVDWGQRAESVFQ